MASLSRQFANCFALWLPTGQNPAEFEEQLLASIAVNDITQRLLKSEISVEDAFDAIEVWGVNMDLYVDEVEANVRDVLEQNSVLAL